MRQYNIRAYGLYLKDNNVLVSEEYFDETKVIKFPGGGLEIGEGIIDCLKREFKEELAIDIDVIQHFYTTDFYQKSAYDGSQVLSVYYLVKLHEAPAFPYFNGAERFYFLPINQDLPPLTPLPIDKVVSSLLLNYINLQH